MIIKWFQTWMRTKAAESSSAARSTLSKAKETSLFDVAHEVLAKEVQERQASLTQFEKYGFPLFHRQRKKQKIKAKVKKFLTIPLAEAEADDLVEEVTEKITDAAEADPKIDLLFGEHSK